MFNVLECDGQIKIMKWNCECRLFGARPRPNKSAKCDHPLIILTQL